MPTWPSTLPKPIIGSFNEQPANNILRTQMDVGPAKVRRRSTANIIPISFTLRMTATQRATLLSFYNTDTVSGSLQFDYTHPVTSAAVKARFAELPKISGDSTVAFDAQISLEIMP